MAKIKMNFPDIRKALYAGNSLEEIRSLYINQLRETGSIYNMLYANKLEEAMNMLDIHSLHELEAEFHDLKEYLRSWTNERSIHCLLKRRQKDWVGFNEKIQLYLLNGKPLGKLLDLLGFRIVICHDTADNIESIKLCYDLLNEVIDFFVNDRHCLLLEAEPRLDTGFDSDKHPEVIIPEKSLIRFGLESNVKDYIQHPKRNGYQSLHTIVKRPDGLTFEVQIRTYSMDLRAEYGTGDHAVYKNNRYSDLDLNIDYTKIHVPGFSVLPNGAINDIIGLRKSVDPFNFL